eukprot:TRINITY_DN4096_c0_g1_i1.p1 TRINITY_DN4096_c0_g1~~TRINITY_DN4096_c0_g1_i1.p1  ORF type:complete len:911 (+),score=296.56 TRINITY_DN4096_c0_g1_i1:80-2812(+)
MSNLRKQNDSKFFQTTKRGEIQELKEELHSTDKAKQRDAVKKVIAAMTVGKDVSALFADVVNCIQTDSIELKKLVYLYVMNYAKAQPELAILAINTFRKDASDSNPLVRALAVRTMGCIRLDQVTEYLLEPLRKCCHDSDPYVRKTAAICIPKVYDINPELVDDQGFLEILEELANDNNPMVVANAVAGLSEISETCKRDLLKLEKGPGSEAIDKLLTALRDCNEWGQVFILDAIATYAPRNSKGAEEIADKVTARFSHANPAVVLGAIKVVLKQMDYINNQEIVRLLSKKLNPPLVTLLSCEPEIQYVGLRNIRLVAQKRPGLLSAEVKMFFCKYNDPVYVKLEKVDIMVMLVNEKNFEQVLMELKEYSSGVDVDFVRKSVRCIGRVAVKLERACERAIGVLLDLIETKVNYVVQEATVVIKDIFRKYPSRYEQVLSALCDSLEVLDEPEAKASMIWILGEYAERIDGVEGLLEEFLGNFHDEAVMVQMQLLTAIVKLFLKKPASTQNMVSKVLKCATEETQNHDLRDRGYIYWRLLSTNPEATKTVVLGDKPSIRDDSQTLEKNLLDRLVTDLSLMSSIYYKTQEDFVTRINVTAETEDLKEAAGSAGEEDMDEDERAARRREVQDEMARGPRDDGAANGKASSGGGGGGALDLLDLDGGLTSAPAPTPSIQKQSVLAPTANGQGGRNGLGISAVVARQNGSPQLLMTISNSTGGPLSGFMIQLNKNPFGLGPATQWVVPEVPNGGSTETSLPLAPGTLLSGQPPTNPLFLQVAVKTNIDIFYFTVPFELPVVLTENASIDRDSFTQVWQAVGDQGQITFSGHLASPLDEEAIKARLAQDNIHFVARRIEGDATMLFFAAATTNNVVLTCEVAVRSGATPVRVATRTQLTGTVPLLEAALCKRLGISR